MCVKELIETIKFCNREIESNILYNLEMINKSDFDLVYSILNKLEISRNKIKDVFKEVELYEDDIKFLNKDLVYIKSEVSRIGLFIKMLEREIYIIKGDLAINEVADISRFIDISNIIKNITGDINKNIESARAYIG